MYQRRLSLLNFDTQCIFSYFHSNLFSNLLRHCMHPATYFMTMKNAKLFQIVILVPRFKYCEFLLSRSSTRKCWTGFWLRQKCGRLAFTTPWQQRRRRSCKISSSKFLVNYLSALKLTLIGCRGMLIGEKSDSNEGTLILTAMKISRRITKQKGDWK